MSRTPARTRRQSGQFAALMVVRGCLCGGTYDSGYSNFTARGQR